MAKINIVCYALGILFGSVALGIALTVAQEAWKSNEHVKAISWSALVVLLALAAAYVGALPMAMQADAEVAARRNPSIDPFTEVKKLLETQSAAQLRPYMVITAAEMLWPLKVGENVVVSIFIKNAGKTPASNVRMFGRLEYEPIGSRVNRKYDELQPQDDGGETVAVEQTILIDLVSGRLTQEQFENVTTGAYHLVAHGRVRYESSNIDGGRDDLLFCQYYDTLIKKMTICGPLLADYDPPKEQRKN